MIRTFFFVVIAGGLLGALVYYLGYPQVTATQHTIVDAHTTVTVVNNVPTDYASIALLILSVAVLLFVVARYVMPAIQNWRRP